MTSEPAASSCTSLSLKAVVAPASTCFSSAFGVRFRVRIALRYLHASL